MNATSIPTMIGKMTYLTSLTLARNSLQDLPSEFAQLTRMEYLFVSLLSGRSDSVL